MPNYAIASYPTLYFTKRYSDVFFHIHKIEGTILAPKDPEVWNGLNPRRWLYFFKVKHLTVEGGGNIDGMGQEWWARSCKVNRTNVILFAIVYIVLYGTLSHNEFDVSFILPAVPPCSNGQFCLSLCVILILTYTVDISFVSGKKEFI